MVYHLLRMPRLLVTVDWDRWKVCHLCQAWTITTTVEVSQLYYFFFTCMLCQIMVPLSLRPHGNSPFPVFQVVGRALHTILPWHKRGPNISLQRRTNILWWIYFIQSLFCHLSLTEVIKSPDWQDLADIDSKISKLGFGKVLQRQSS